MTVLLEQKEHYFCLSIIVCMHDSHSDGLIYAKKITQPLFTSDDYSYNKSHTHFTPFLYKTHYVKYSE